MVCHVNVEHWYFSDIFFPKVFTSFFFESYYFIFLDTTEKLSDHAKFDT